MTTEGKMKTTLSIVVLLASLGITIQGLPTTPSSSGICVTSCAESSDGDYQSCKGCHVYVTCLNQEMLDDRPCPGDLVWDDLVKRCEHSSNTCAESDAPDTPTDPLVGVCPEGFSGLHPDPENCARYYLCIDGTVEQTTLYRAQRECPYPYLFSSERLDCSYFTDVSCGNRTEPKAPCDYFGPVRTLDPYPQSRNKRSFPRQGNGWHGPPCEVYLPPCLGLPDGPNPWIGRKDSPYYVECKDERTIRTEYCPDDFVGEPMIFSQEDRKCISKWDYPAEKGGRRPNCFMKPDGFYPDEQSWCPYYYECKNGKFQAFYKCPNSWHFSDISGKCESGEFVPVPCGGAGSPSCQNKDDGFYPDVNGRCPYFFACVEGQARGVFKCENPGHVFNPDTAKCDSRENTTMPCGQL